MRLVDQYTKEMAIAELTEMAEKEFSDEEVDHSVADGILLIFLRHNGFADVAEAYEKARTAVGFWYA